MAEGIEPGVADQQIEAHGEEAEDQRLDDDGEHVVRRDERHQAGGDRADNEPDFQFIVIPPCPGGRRAAPPGSPASGDT